MKVVYTGLESSGKTLCIANKVIELITRNKIWFKKFGFRRLIYSNLKFSDEFEEENKEYIRYWQDVKELLELSGVDIIHDEISSYYSALKREPLPIKVNQWLRQGAKQGVHIYGTAQEFHDIHLDFRRRVFKAYKASKLIGSPRGGENLPPVKTIWGVVRFREIKIHPYNELMPEFEFSIPPFDCLFFGKKLCSIFNTYQILSCEEALPLEHIERICSKPGCNFKRITHR